MAASFCSARLQAGICSIRRCRRKGQRYKASLLGGFLAFILAATLLVMPGTIARAGTASPIPQEEKPPAGNVQNGKKLYISYGCFECHGRQAEGTSVGGPRLGPNPISFPAFTTYLPNPPAHLPPFTSKPTSAPYFPHTYPFS